MTGRVLLILGAVVTVSCARPAMCPIKCERVDLTKGGPQISPEILKLGGLDWMKDAYICTSGEKSFAVPIDASREDYVLVVKGKEEVLRGQDNHLFVFDEYYLHVGLYDSNHDGHFDSLDYSTWKAKNHYVNATDWNLDGQPDWRSMERPDGSIRNEVWLTDRWREITVKEGMWLTDDPGTRVKKGADGTFVAIPAERH